GQVQPMRQILAGLGIGLLLAAGVIGLLLTAYFQSLRLALAVVSTAPAVLLRGAPALLLTRTTLDIPSFLGAIMALGVAVGNAVWLVRWGGRARVGDSPPPPRGGGGGGVGGMAPRDAAVDGARHRLRPILMTTCAMIAGMLPMALGLGEGAEQVAPLG